MIIYKTTNLINGKIYIGQSNANDPNYLGSGTTILKAINKYGKENFIIEILEICGDKEQLNIRETYWIKFFNSTNIDIGYNIRPGGFSSTHSQETKDKISKTLTGKTQSASTIKKRSKTLTGRKLSNDHKKKLLLFETGNSIKLGCKNSVSTKLKMSKAKKGKNNPRFINFNGCQLIDIINLRLLKNSDRSISKILGVSRTPITRVLKEYNLN